MMPYQLLPFPRRDASGVCSVRVRIPSGNVVVAGYSFKVARGMSAGGAYTHSCRGRSVAE